MIILYYANAINNNAICIVKNIYFYKLLTSCYDIGKKFRD